MFFRTFKQLLGCGHLLSGKHNGVEIQAYWVTAILAERKSQATKSAMGAGAKIREKRQKIGKTSSREKLGSLR
jgi:hypothetical protein